MDFYNTDVVWKYVKSHTIKEFMNTVYSSESSKKIQILRAIAIMAVVAIHTCATGTIGVIIRPFLNFAVALFLGLSGYLTKTDLPLRKVRKRILRVFIPYTIWSLIFTAVRHTWSDFPENFLTGYSCGVFYFVVVYMELTLLAPLVGRLVRSRWRPLGFLVTPVSILVEYILEFRDHEIPKPYNEVFFPVWFLFFYLGMLLRYDIDHGKTDLFTNKQKRRSFVKKILILLPFSLLIQIGEGLLWMNGGYGRMQYTQIKLGTMATSSLIILLAVCWIRSSVKIPFAKWISRFLVYVGDISFGIYFTHILFRDFLEKTLAQVIDFFFPMETILILVLDITAIYVIRKVCSQKFCKVMGLI